MEIEYNQPKTLDMLNKLEISQESITNASGLFLTLGRSQGADIIKSLVQDWNQAFSKFLNLEKMNMKILAMMYLLNDIIQNSRMKQNSNCMNFLNLFQEVLSKHMKDLIEQADPALKKELYKIFLIWKERKVYPIEWLNEYLSLFKVNDDKSNEMMPENAITIPPELIVYAQSYQDYSRWKEKTEENCNNLKHLENIMVLENFDEVKTDCELVAYKRSLDIQNKYRVSYLRNSGELLKNVEKNHAKMVFNLKNVCKTLHEIEAIEEQIKI